MISSGGCSSGGRGGHPLIKRLMVQSLAAPVSRQDTKAQVALQYVDQGMNACERKLVCACING